MFRFAAIIAISGALVSPAAAADDTLAVAVAIISTTICTDKYPDLKGPLDAALGAYESRASHKPSAVERKYHTAFGRGLIDDGIDDEMLRGTSGIKDTRMLCDNLVGKLRSGSPAKDTKILEARAETGAENYRKARVKQLQSSPKQLALLNRLSAAGLEIHDPSPLFISGMKPGSRAAQAGVRMGDVVTSLNGRPVEDWGDMAEAVAKTPQTATLRFELKRGPDTRTVEVPAR